MHCKEKTRVREGHDISAELWRIWRIEPSRTRTPDPLVKRAVKRVPSSRGSYDLFTFYTGCSRFGVQLVTTIHASLPVFTSQICHNRMW